MPKISQKQASSTVKTSAPSAQEAFCRHPDPLGGENVEAAVLLSAIVESSDDAIISKNLDGIITSWNRGAERIFGYSPEETIGRLIYLLIPPELAKEETIILSRLKHGERIEHFETVRIRKDGTRLEVSLTVSPVKNRDGKIVGASKIARDISERKRFEEQLREERERLHVTLASIGDGVIVTDLAGHVQFLNPVGEALTGWKQSEAKGQPLEVVFQIFNEHTHRPVVNPALRALKEGRIVGLANHTVLIARDGAKHLLDDSGSPVRRADGTVIGAVLIFRDVGDRRAAEESRARLAAIVESSDDAIIGKDLQGRITSWNKGAERIFGYTKNEMLGELILRLIPPDRLNEEEEILEHLRRGGRMDHFETVRISKDGHKIPVSLTISPIKDAAGNVIGASKIARDITRRKQTDEALSKAREELEVHALDLEARVAERTAHLQQSVAELEGVSYSLSHDMRAPLRTIQSFSQIVLAEAGEKLGPNERELLRKSISAAGRLDRLIRDVLIYSRVSREAIEISTVDVEQLLRQIIDERPEFQSPKAEIKIQPPLEPVRGHESYLTQCITNLLDNAVKFVSPDRKPQVRVWSESTDHQVRIWFEDNGIGIAKDSQERIFGIFQRVHDEKTYPGTGIGLPIVRKAVGRMGGTVGVESEPDRGSRFWLQLPRGDSADVK